MLRWFFIIIILLFSACVPVSEGERVAVTQLADEVTYYPHQVGAVWEYLEEGSLVDSTPVRKRVEGPTIVAGELWVQTRVAGLGFDISGYRQYRSDGVYLLREERPGTQITFDPPIQQFPEEGSLRVGLTWAGSTTAKLFFPDASPESQRQELDVDYSYTVVDQRTVNPPAGEFEVFVINFVSRSLDDEGNIVDDFTQETWFAPFIGEVRTAEGYFLTASNVAEAQVGN